MLDRQLPYVEALFPIALWQNNIGTPTREQVKFVEDLEWRPLVEGNYGTLKIDILDEPIFANVKSQIMENVNQFAYEVYRYVDVEWRMTMSWGTANPKGASHHMHWHHNSFFSGVYYLNVPENAPGIRFLREKHVTFDLTKEEFNRYNSPAWDLHVETGDVIIFPSDTMHQVLKNESDTPRMVVPFNIWFSGETGEKLNYTWLKT